MQGEYTFEIFLVAILNKEKSNRYVILNMDFNKIHISKLIQYKRYKNLFFVICYFGGDKLRLAWICYAAETDCEHLVLLPLPLKC